MATINDGREFTVFKFEETGVVALCAEVVEYAKDGTFDRYNVMTDSFRFEKARGEFRFIFQVRQGVKR